MITPTEPSVTLVILTWNQREVTLDCLQSLVGMDYPANRLQVIVVDNGSNDGTDRAIRESYPEVTVLTNAENLGFAEGNNTGIRHALAHKADYIMLLNNDTVVDPRMLRYLIAAAEDGSDVGIVTPKIYYYEPADRIWCAGATIDWRTGLTARAHAEEADSETDRGNAHEVDFASGCAICLKRQAVEEIGLLDGRFFIYYEETDWCVRARKAGWRILYVPDAHVWHKVSTAMGTTSPATDYYMTRNVLLFLSKNTRGIHRALALMRAASRNLLAIVAYTIKPHKGQRLPRRNARLLALRDVVLGHWGKMPSDVAAICYPK